MIEDNKKVVLKNEGAYTVHLTNPNSRYGFNSRIIPPHGRLVIDFCDLRDSVYASLGNKEIIADYLTIEDAEVRRELGIDHIDIITDEQLHTMLKLASGEEIANKLPEFLKSLGAGQLDRIAQMAIDENISDMRIIAQLEKYTPYKSIGNQINDNLSAKL